ncbi:MAG TPA: hypothetical protein PK358_02830 [Spirochaetota bacterium]|nr:hypothetical protein [Spirochaetota bacterium]HPJ33742.1 hypothetical protein [Spirochaetota bacterium]
MRSVKKEIYSIILVCLFAILSCGNLINETALNDDAARPSSAGGFGFTELEKSYSLSGEIRIEKIDSENYYMAGSVTGESSTDVDNVWFSSISNKGEFFKGGFLVSDYDDRVRRVKVLDSKNVIIFADRYYESGDIDFIIVKYNRNKGVLWDYCFGNDKKNRIFDATETVDGGIVVTGMSYYSVLGAMSYITFIMKIDANGNLVWEKNYKSYFSVFMPSEIHRIGEEEYIVSGLCLNALTYKFRTFFARMDSSGNILSSMYINAINRHSMLAGSVVREDDGMTAVISLVGSSDSDVLAVINFDSDMNVLSTREFSFPDLNVRGKIVRGEDEDIIVAGMLNSTAGNGLYFLKLTEEGVIKSLNTKIYDSEIYDIYDVYFGSAEDENGIIYMCKYSNSVYSSADGKVFLDSFNFGQSDKNYSRETLLTKGETLYAESTEYETGDVELDSDTIVVEEKGEADLVLVVN